MDPGRIAKLTSRYESGLVSASETANALLYDLVSERELDAAFLSSLDSLPQEVGREFRRLQEKIEAADYRWTPFFLTSSSAPADPTEYSARLRRVSALLEQGTASNGETRPEESVGRERTGAGKASKPLAGPD